MDLHVFPIPIPSPTSLSTRFLWVFPVQQSQAVVSCNQPGLVICFILDNIHVSICNPSGNRQWSYPKVPLVYFLRYYHIFPALLGEMSKPIIIVSSRTVFTEIVISVKTTKNVILSLFFLCFKILLEPARSLMAKRVTHLWNLHLRPFSFYKDTNILSYQ